MLTCHTMDSQMHSMRKVIRPLSQIQSQFCMGDLSGKIFERSYLSEESRQRAKTTVTGMLIR